MEAIVYTQKGSEASKVTLPEAIFGLPWNADLVHQVVVSMQSNARASVAHTKNRGDVRGGGKKPWKQKGTGRARHGSTRSPIWVGGGVTHGPRNEKDYSRKVNKKMKTKALFTILSRKFKNGEVLFVDSLSFAKPQTKDAKQVISSLSKIKGFEGLATKKRNTAYIASADSSPAFVKSFANFGNMDADATRNINPIDLMKYKYVVMVNPSASFDALLSKKQ